MTESNSERRSFFSSIFGFIFGGLGAWFLPKRSEASMPLAVQIGEIEFPKMELRYVIGTGNNETPLFLLQYRNSPSEDFKYVDAFCAQTSKIISMQELLKFTPRIK